MILQEMDVTKLKYQWTSEGKLSISGKDTKSKISQCPCHLKIESKHISWPKIKHLHILVGNVENMEPHGIIYAIPSY